ncbi:MULTISPECIES: hypothetical protein [unclassified Petrotoga]|uniref:hypothetical protein n=1 Tax=unclassified Petrotoga TaxID=2620614 RepID=UPI000CA00D85|nr:MULTISPECIES: hypothetical protein [unclassified Petrotoga]PNR91830.1 hypothetical protein X926_07770 [Petrotoga sp. HWHPT.55.6.3]
MFSERKLSSLLSFSKNTVSKSLSELEDRGLITCYPRRVNSLTANEEDSLMANEEDSLMANEEDNLTANEEGGLTANEEGGLTANEEASLKRPERGSRKDSLTANVKGKEAFSSTFWFPEVQLRETASSAPKGVQGKTASQQIREEKKEVYDKGGSKYAKFF